MLSLFLVLPVALGQSSAQNRLAGVQPGDWFQYTSTLTGDPSGLTGLLPCLQDADWFNMTIDYVTNAGKTVAYHVTVPYTNGSLLSVMNVTENVDFADSPANDYLIAASNLTAGDTLFSGGSGSAYAINETINRAYLAAVRPTNHLSISNEALVQDSYFEQATGVVTSAETRSLNPDATTRVHLVITLTASNVALSTATVQPSASPTPIISSPTPANSLTASVPATASSSSQASRNVPRDAGVKVGDWFNFSVSTSGDTVGKIPSSCVDADWSYATITDVSGKLVAYQTDLHYKNGTLSTMGNLMLNLETGASAPAVGPTFTLLAAGLAVGDPIFSSGPLSAYQINDTISMNNIFDQKYTFYRTQSPSMEPPIPTDSYFVLDKTTSAAELNAIDGKIYFFTKGDQAAPSWPNPINQNNYDIWKNIDPNLPLGAVSQDLVVGRVINVLGAVNQSSRLFESANHVVLNTDLGNGTLREDDFWDQKTGVPLVASQLFNSNDNASMDYAVTFTLTDTSLWQPPTLNEILPPLAVGSGVVGGALVATQVASSAVSHVQFQLPKPIQDLVRKFTDKHVEKLNNDEVKKKKKHAFISKLEVATLSVAIIIMTIGIGVSNALKTTGSYHAAFEPSTLSVYLFTAFVSACIVQTVTLFADAICSRLCAVVKEIKPWFLGSVIYLVTGVVFKMPFSSPSVMKYSDNLSEKTADAKRAKGLLTLSKTLMILLLTIPFALMTLAPLPIIGTIGSSGLYMVLIAACCAFMPISPLPGKSIFDYNKAASLIPARRITCSVAFVLGKIN
jgi:hypothetical protein